MLSGCLWKRPLPYGYRDVTVLAMIALSTVLISACWMPSSNHLNRLDLSGEPAFPSWTTDARARLISNENPQLGSRPGMVNPSNIVCVEPAAGVAAAVAGSFATGISVLQYGSGALSANAAEQLIQTEERTISIQALLNAGYQNCLDYANGAISGTSYAIRTASLDDLLVTLVSVDAAAGNYGRTLAASTGTATSSSKASVSGPSAADVQLTTQQLGAANRQVKKDQQALQTNQDALTQKTKAASDAKAASDKTPTDAALQTTSGNAAKDQTDAQTAVDRAKGQLQTDEVTRDGLQQSLQSQADTMASGTAGGERNRGRRIHGKAFGRCRADNC